VILKKCPPIVTDYLYKINRYVAKKGTFFDLYRYYKCAFLNKFPDFQVINVLIKYIPQTKIICCLIAVKNFSANAHKMCPAAARGAARISPRCSTRYGEGSGRKQFIFYLIDWKRYSRRWALNCVWQNRYYASISHPAQAKVLPRVALGSPQNSEQQQVQLI